MGALCPCGEVHAQKRRLYERKLIMDELKHEIETVKSLLKDESAVLSVDSRCLESGKEFERDTELPKHPLQGLCLVSCLLFKKLSKSGREYDLYQIPKVFYTVKGRDRNRRFKKVRECSTHYFLKHKRTNQIIDLTSEQFRGEGIPYNQSVRRTSLNLSDKILVADANNDFTSFQKN